MGHVARQVRHGMTLVELLLVIAMIGILAGIAIPSLSSTSYDEVIAAAQVLESEISYARNLATANASTYRLAFDATNNRTILTHVGSDTSLNTLPQTPFRNPTDPANQQITDLDDLPRLQAAPRLIGGYRVVTSYPSVANIEFGPFGNVVSTTDSVVVYLAAGNGTGTIYISLTVNPVTGLVAVGTPTNSIPVATGP